MLQRSIVAISAVLFSLFSASTALAQTPFEDHRGSGRYSENPTIPGDGTPGRTQGSGTR